MRFSRTIRHLRLLPLVVLLTTCASLEERLCNQNTAFQKGYDDVINGRQASPGLQEGEACRKSVSYAYDDYHRDYTAGFNKAKVAHCTQENAMKLGQNDAATNKDIHSSLDKLSICIADEKIKVNLENVYETGYRKEFCQTARAEKMGNADAANFGDPKRSENDFNLCAYQKVPLHKAYLQAYRAALKLQCTSSRAAALASETARSRKNISTGLILLEKCPANLTAQLTNVYSVAFQSERSNMMEEERLRMEQERLDREEANRLELLKIKRRQLELEEQKLKPTQQL